MDRDGTSGSGRRRLTVPAVAVAVVAVLLGGRWLSATPAQDEVREPAGARATVTDGAPRGTVPSVFAHTRASATALLEGLGLAVETEEHPGCDPSGSPVGTTPATGRPVEPGDTVSLHIAVPGPTIDCAVNPREGWEFLRFAHGRGTSPRFADEVTLVVDDGEPTTVSGDELAHGEWGRASALTALRQAGASTLHVDGSYESPRLDQREGTPPGAICGVRRPPVVGDREALTLAITLPGGATHCPATVALYRTDGRIDTVVTWTEKRFERPAATEPVPDIVGLDLADARAAVSDAGYTARVEERETCDPRPGVVEQAPTRRDLEVDLGDDPDWSRVVTLVVETPHTTRDCAGLAHAAASFTRFTRGGPAPAWAPTVELYLGYAFHSRITGAAADDRDAWALCPALAPADCGASAVRLVAANGVRSSADMPSYECLQDLGGLPLRLSSEDWMVLHPRSVSRCRDQWVVHLWVDDQQRVAAVNVMVAAG